MNKTLVTLLLYAILALGFTNQIYASNLLPIFYHGI